MECQILSIRGTGSRLKIRLNTNKMLCIFELDNVLQAEKNRRRIFE